MFGFLASIFHQCLDQRSLSFQHSFRSLDGVFRNRPQKNHIALPLVIDSIGYNMEIKFQNPYTLAADMPVGPNRTIIRNNVFLKRIAQADWTPNPEGSPRTSGARPNLLVGGFPDSGPGSHDLYEIYANFFYANPDEALLQASGRVAIHDNIFVAASDAAIRLQNHDRLLKLAYVYNNTVYGGPQGIHFGNAASENDAVVGNLVFGEAPIVGSIRNLRNNLTGSTAEAANYLAHPSLSLGAMDFYPLSGQCQGPALDLGLFSAHLDFDRDFNGNLKASGLFRGAYSGSGRNPGWQLSDKLKVGGPSSKGTSARRLPKPSTASFSVVVIDWHSSFSLRLSEFARIA